MLSETVSRVSSTETSWTRPLPKSERPLGAAARLLTVRMVENNMWYTPTISCNGIMMRAPYERFLKPSAWDKNAMVAAKGLNALKVGAVLRDGNFDQADR